MLNWYWVLALSFPAYIIQVAIHEGAHALFAISQGQKILEFRLWPGFYDDGRFFWARVKYQRSPTLLLTDAQMALRAWAPFVVGLPLWIGFAALGSQLVALELSQAVTSVWAVAWTALSVDVVRNLAWAALHPKRDYLDLNKGAYYAGLPSWGTRAIGWTLTGLMTTYWALVMYPIVRASF